MKVYYITQNKSVEIKGAEIVYRASKMMVYSGFVSMICVGVNCSPITACVGISVLSKCI